MNEKIIEIWRPIVGWENTHLISNCGRVASFLRAGNNKIKLSKTATLLKLSKNRRGYFRFALGVKQKFKTREVHRLVASHFVENVMNKPEVNHKDGIKINNFYKNLEWVTRRENCQHAQDTGLNKSRYSAKQKKACQIMGEANKGRTPWNKRK